MTRIAALIVAALLTAGFAAPAFAGPKGGAVRTNDTVRANHTDCFTVTLRAEEITTVILSGDGGTCLEVRVYDENSNLVASDTVGFGDDREVQVLPKWTGKFTIKVRNLGTGSNDYTLTVK